MQNAYAITAMTQPFLDWGLALANRSKTKRDKVFTMSYPRIDDAPSIQDISELRVRLNINENDIVACFLGNLSYQCDFDVLINAAKRLIKKYPNFKIVIAGSGPYEKLLEDTSVNQKNFIFAGWLDGVDIKSLLYLSKIGLVPYKPSSSFLKSISNKYPEYLAGEIAIACGLSGEMARLTKRITADLFMNQMSNPFVRN